MPALPEDIIDRLRALERRIQQLYTAANSRPPLNKFTDGTLEVFPPGSDTPIFEVGQFTGQEYGIRLSRQTGQPVLDVYYGDGTSTVVQPFRLHDAYGHEIISDDIGTGGLARPWLAMLPPQDTAPARWPQTSSTAWTTVARSQNPLWQPKMRLLIATAASSGSVSGQIRVLVNSVQWGVTVNTGSNFDYTGPTVDPATFNSMFGSMVTVEIQAMVTSGTGTVYAQPIAMYGTQT